MRTSQIGKDLIKFFEGEKLTAYVCPAGVPTIGVGSTFYEDGAKVKIGDKITKERSAQLFTNTLKPFEQRIQLKKNELIRVNSKIEVSIAEYKNRN